MAFNSAKRTAAWWRLAFKAGKLDAPRRSGIGSQQPGASTRATAMCPVSLSVTRIVPAQGDPDGLRSWGWVRDSNEMTDRPSMVSGLSWQRRVIWVHRTVEPWWRNARTTSRSGCRAVDSVLGLTWRCRVPTEKRTYLGFVSAARWVGPKAIVGRLCQARVLGHLHSRLGILMPPNLRDSAENKYIICQKSPKSRPGWGVKETE